MKVQCTLVGMVGHPAPPVWPEGWPIPRQDEEVYLRDRGGPATGLFVRHVVWYPEGDPDDPDDHEPFVYLVVGPRRREWT